VIKEGEDPRTAFVCREVLPAFEGFDFVKVEDARALRQRYWETWAAVRNHVLSINSIEPWETGELRKVLTLVVDNGMPVESAFLRAAQEDAVQRAIAEQGVYNDAVLYGVELAGPYAPTDVATVLEENGYNPDLNRTEVAEVVGVSGRKHNPVIDARQSMVVMDAARSRHQVLEPYVLV
jgi:hypothetical protein